jgi:hypothetical protein
MATYITLAILLFLEAAASVGTAAFRLHNKSNGTFHSDSDSAEHFLIVNSITFLSVSAFFIYLAVKEHKIASSANNQYTIFHNPNNADAETNQRRANQYPDNRVRME